MTGFVRPGPLREAHAHIAQHGRAMTMARLDACLSRDECLQRLAAAASRAPSAEWLLGSGLRAESWPDPRYPTARELDQATGDRPAAVWSFDYHALIASTAALRAANISAATPDPPHGRIVRDNSPSHTPTGLLLESAAHLLWSRIPEPGPEERRDQVLAALADLASHGFTEIHDLLAPAWLGPLLADLHDHGRLPIIRILLYMRRADLEAALLTRSMWERPTIRLAGEKLFADGTLNSRTASMLHPYVDPLPDLPRGDAMLTQSQLRDAILRTRSLNLGLAVHAIGDAAVRTVLDAYESTNPNRARQEADGERQISDVTDARSTAPPLRIEHAEIIDPADVPRFARLGVACSVQPCHLLADIEALNRYLPHRLDRVLPLRELIDSGCRPGELLLFGSDTPIVRPHPEDCLQAAVHRRRANMPASAAIAPDQAITASESWAAFAAASAGRPR